MMNLKSQAVWEQQVTLQEIVDEMRNYSGVGDCRVQLPSGNKPAGHHIHQQYGPRDGIGYAEFGGDREVGWYRRSGGS